MKCPRTGTNLKQVKVGGITINISEKCGGVFFENTTINNFDEKDEKRGAALVEHLKQFIPPPLDLSNRIKCPNCCSIVMGRHFYSPKNKIEIDDCPGCGGIWLDFGELEKLHELFPTKAHREKADREFKVHIKNSSLFRRDNFQKNIASFEQRLKLFSFLNF